MKRPRIKTTPSEVHLTPKMRLYAFRCFDFSEDFFVEDTDVHSAEIFLRNYLFSKFGVSVFLVPIGSTECRNIFTLNERRKCDDGDLFEFVPELK